MLLAYSFSFRFGLPVIFSFFVSFFLFSSVGNVYKLAYGLEDFNFTAVGDWGCTSETKKMVNNMVDKDPELVLGLGDNAYSDNPKCWYQIVDPIDHKLKAVMGNHDVEPVRLPKYMDYFNLSKQYYSFNHQNVHFIAMSTEVPFELGSQQYNFVASDLKHAVSEPNIKWIIVFYHRFAYGSPTTAEPANQKFGLIKFRETYHPLFEKYGVDLVLQAHSHTYQRSYPLEYNPANASKPLIVENEKTDYYNPKGQIFAIVGTGGTSVTHNFTGPAAEYMAVQFKAFGFLNLHVSHNGTMLTGEFQDNDGTIKDRFTITKLNIKEKNLVPLLTSNQD